MNGFTVNAFFCALNVLVITVNGIVLFDSGILLNFKAVKC